MRYQLNASQYQLDEYYKLIGKEQEEDIAGSKIFRIRTTENQVIYTIKKTIEPGVWNELETEEVELSTPVKMILNSFYSKILTLEKSRSMYQYEQFSLNIDSITNLGTYIEVEVLSELQPEIVKK